MSVSILTPTDTPIIATSFRTKIKPLLAEAETVSGIRTYNLHHKRAMRRQALAKVAARIVADDPGPAPGPTGRQRREPRVSGEIKRI
jgi:hypothetical protein